LIREYITAPPSSRATHPDGQWQLRGLGASLPAMEDLAVASHPTPDPLDTQALGTLINFSGRDRRKGAEAALLRLLTAVLNEVDYGLVLLDGAGQVIHANHRARQDFQDEHPLAVERNRLVCRDRATQGQLEAALTAASRRDQRSLLTMPYQGRALGVSIVPLPGQWQNRLDSTPQGHPILVALQRNGLVESLSVDAFARSYQLSRREQDVLAALCAGHKPAQIAEQLGLGISTVRSHVHNLKSKTGCKSMIELMQKVAVLPPLLGVLKNA
jgi:DNA-binding CsgD family transcriptional regulator